MTFSFCVPLFLSKVLGFEFGLIYSKEEFRFLDMLRNSYTSEDDHEDEDL